MQYEVIQGDSFRRFAESAFLAEAQNALPERAFRALRSVKTDAGIVKWARTWGVFCPSIVLNAVPSWQAGFQIASREGINRPNEWMEHLIRLSDLTPSSRPYVDIAPVISEEQEASERATYADIGHVIRSLDELNLPQRRAQGRVAKHRHDLQPLIADPLLETREQFLDRANAHWDAQAREADRMGYRPVFSVKKAHEFERNLSWLVRYQIGRLSYPDIANDPGKGQTVTARAVTQAIVRLADVLKLELRRSPRGRKSWPATLGKNSQRA